MSAPKVSLLLPCLNARPYLEPRIDSLMTQVYSDWEAIVLDSGSTDGSWELFKSITSADPRFRLYQVPREGVYAALNHGLRLATGDFLHIATCDDTMAPEFLEEMMEALGQCSDAGIAVCNVRFINRNGQDLTVENLTDRLSKQAIRDLLGSGCVPGQFVEADRRQALDYRPPPHDCLMHFIGRSVYFSLTQLVVRMPLARAAGPFEATVGSVADFGWLLRLTNLTGSVHVPKKLAMWRFHGDQLSLRRDPSRRACMRMLCERTVPEISERHPRLLRPDDSAALVLICKTRLASTAAQRFFCRCLVIIRLLRLFFEEPAMTRQVFRETPRRISTPGRILLMVILRRIGLVPQFLFEPKRL